MKSELQKIVLDKISRLLIINDFIISWTNSDSRILNFSINEDIVKLKDVEEVLHGNLLKTGRKSFVQHITTGQYPDHTTSTKALAYALDHNEFTVEEESQIHFDHGETKKEFIQLYGKDILSKLIHFLQTEQKVSTSSTFDDSSCCDGCCGH